MVQRPILLIILMGYFIVGGVFSTSIGGPEMLRLPKDHWARTGVAFKDLNDYINPVSCSGDEKKRLACILALDQMARQVGQTISKEGKFTLIPASERSAKSDRYQQLAWKKLVSFENKIPFLDLIKSIRKKVVGSGRESSIVASGLNAYYSIARDPHTYLVPLSLFEETIGRSTIQDVGVGLVLRRSQGDVYVSRLIPNSQAERKGILRGDKIVAIDSIMVSAANYEEAKQRLMGKSDSRVKIVIARASGERIFFLRREPLVQRSVESKIIETRGIRWGILSIVKFASGTCGEAKSKLIGLLEERISGIAIDLRENGGGQLEEAGCVANLFLEKNRSVYQTSYFDGRTSELYVTRQEPLYLGALSVIVNSGTASAAEILAGALQDHERALLVGERTFGKGSFQSAHIWERNKNIALFETKGLYYLPSGRTAQLHGLKPDVEIAGIGPTALRERDLYINAIEAFERVSTETPKVSLVSLCSLDLIRQAVNMPEFDDPQLRGVWSVMHCLRGMHGLQTDTN